MASIFICLCFHVLAPHGRMARYSTKFPIAGGCGSRQPTRFTDATPVLFSSIAASLQFYNRASAFNSVGI